MVQQEIINLLSEMVKIPSISSDKDHRDDVDASAQFVENLFADLGLCLLYTSPSPRDEQSSRMPSSA